jgi:tripartite-type tricarboxylate transporter receptor subunit TctC
MLISRRAAIGALGGALLAPVVSRPVLAQEAFYKDKRLTVLVNYAAGGPTDVEGRLFAKYLARYLDGAPNVIVQNMDGAGGLVGNKYLGEVAPRDGMMVG